MWRLAHAFDFAGGLPVEADGALCDVFSLG